jgi:DNA-binding NarL/FixJ family response regulator
MLTTSDSDGDLQRALRAGAQAHIVKRMPKSQLPGLIRSARAGRRHTPAVAARRAEHLGDDHLTTRELGVLRLFEVAQQTNCESNVDFGDHGELPHEEPGG